MSKTKLIPIALFSCGWLAPLYIAYSFYAKYLDRLQSQELHSFPLLGTSEKFFLIACIWLAAVVIFWSLAIGKKIFQDASSKTISERDK
jgi:hypothetical protein